MGLTVNRQMAQKLTVNSRKRNIFTVNRQMSEPKLTDWGQVMLLIIDHRNTYLCLLVSSESDRTDFRRLTLPV